MCVGLIILILYLAEIFEHILHFLKKTLLQIKKIKVTGIHIIFTMFQASLQVLYITHVILKKFYKLGIVTIPFFTCEETEGQKKLA